MSEIRDMIQHALDQDYNKANDVFGEVLSVKIQDVLDQEKIRLANQIYNGYDEYEEEDDYDTEDDQELASMSDEEIDAAIDEFEEDDVYLDDDESYEDEEDEEK